MWKLVAGDAPATLIQAMKLVVKSVVKPAPAEIAFCGRGRLQTINEKLKEIAAMGPAAASQYSGSAYSKKKAPSRKPTFPTKEEQEAKR